MLVCNSDIHRAVISRVPGRKGRGELKDFNIVNSEDALLVRVMNFGIVLRFFGFNPSVPRGVFSCAPLVGVST